jgi:hypothetical protein
MVRARLRARWRAGPDGSLGRDAGGARDDTGEGGARHEAAAQSAAALLPAGHGEEGALASEGCVTAGAW